MGDRQALVGPRGHDGTRRRSLRVVLGAGRRSLRVLLVACGLLHNVFHDCCEGEWQLVDCSVEVSQKNILALNHSYIWYS